MAEILKLIITPSEKQRLDASSSTQGQERKQENSQRSGTSPIESPDPNRKYDSIWMHKWQNNSKD